MGFTTESIEAAPLGTQTNQPNQFNIPSKEFIGYDPNGTHSITGSPLVKPAEKPAETPANAPIPDVPREESITLSKGASAILRKEQAVRAQQKALAEKERTFAEKMADAEKYHKLKQKLEAKDYSAIDELGVPYEEIVKHEINKEAAKDPAQERVKRLEEEMAALKKGQEEQTVKDYEANQALWKKEISRVTAESSDFPLVKKKGADAEAAILQHINDSFEEDETELTVEQAAKDIEEALSSKAKEWASLLESDENKVPEAKVLGAPKTKVSTITQNMTVTSKEVKPKPFHLMSESEQIQEAIRRVQAAKQQR